jgi:hypothetical protein
MQPGQPPFQTVLDQVVGTVAVAEEGERVAPQMRDLLDDLALALVYGCLPGRTGVPTLLDAENCHRLGQGVD